MIIHLPSDSCEQWTCSSTHLIWRLQKKSGDKSIYDKRNDSTDKLEQVEMINCTWITYTVAGTDSLWQSTINLTDINVSSFNVLHLFLFIPSINSLNCTYILLVLTKSLIILSHLMLLRGVKFTKKKWKILFTVKREIN